MNDTDGRNLSQAYVTAERHAIVSSPTTVSAWDDIDARVHGDAAVVIGRGGQQASYHGKPVDGTFRISQTFVRDEWRWRIVGVQLSPIATPLPGS